MYVWVAASWRWPESEAEAAGTEGGGKTEESPGPRLKGLNTGRWHAEHRGAAQQQVNSYGEITVKPL